MGNEGQSWLPHQKIQSAWKGMRKEPVMKDRNKGKSEVTYKRLEGDCRFKRHHALYFQEHAFAIIIFLNLRIYQHILHNWERSPGSKDNEQRNHSTSIYRTAPY